jgi:hypothetical protein
MHRTALIALALLLAVPAQAGKHWIAGRVTDRNGEPVDNAIVSLAPGNVQLVTDRDGQFLIDYLRDPAGERTKLEKKTMYDLEIFKPGFHVAAKSLDYRKGIMDVEAITLVEETIEIHDDGENLDPDLYADSTHSSGANYEGQ